MKLALIATVTLLQIFCASPLQADDVKLRQGVLSGMSSKGIKVYKGISYAEAPTGDHRWQPPRPIKPGKAKISADQYGPACLQSETKNLQSEDMSEDCLSLNVWTKDTNAKQPVMVWIHGGGFRGGSNRISGEVFAQKNNVLVSLNYRLGALGFFAHDSLDQPIKNFGLLDLELALKWIQENISSFGGDPDNVTIFGVSAGGQAVNLLMSSPRVDGLFHRAISQSGYATWPLPRSKNVPMNAPHNLFMEQAYSAEAMDRKLISSISTAPQTAAMLRSLDGNVLVNAQQGFRLPIVDGVSLLEEPGILFLRGQQAMVPLMTGGNSYEGSVMGGTTLRSADIERSMGDDLEEAHTYYGNEPDNIWQRRLFGDMRYLLSSRVTANTMGEIPVWLYFIDFLPEVEENKLGTSHGSDAWFLFSGLSSEHPAIRSLSNRMIDYWSQFARNGNPNSAETSVWPSYNPGKKSWLIFDNPDRVGRAIIKEKLDFLEQKYLARISPVN